MTTITTIKKRKQLKRTVFLSTVLFASFGIFSLTASADTLSILQTFHFEQNSVISTFLRQIGWSLVLGLHTLVSGLEGVVYNINGTLGGFFTSDSVQQLTNKVLPLAVALLVIVIAYIGITFMIKPQNGSTILGNFVVGVVIAIALPMLLSSAYTFTSQAIGYLMQDQAGNFQQISDKILLENVTDNTRYDLEDFQSNKLTYKSYYAMPGVDGKGITSIDSAELVNPDSMKYPDVWKNGVSTDQNGKQTLSGLDGGLFGIKMLSNYYYRWNIDFFNIFVTLIVTGFALIMSGIKIARLLYELAIHQVMTQVMALLDIVTAQRLKKCLQSLIATFGTLFAVFWMLQLYIVGMAYITNVSDIFLRLILMIALAWAVIDGPNLFEQLFGVDAGIHSALRTMYGMKAAGGMLAGGAALLGGRGAVEAMKAKGITGMAKSVLGRAGGIAGTVGGAASGVASGVKDTRNRVNAVRSGAGVAGAAAAAASAVKSAVSGSSTGGSGSSVSYESGTGSGGFSGGGLSGRPLSDDTRPPMAEDTGVPDAGQVEQKEPAPSAGGKRERAAANQPETLGGKIKAAAAAKIQQSSAVTSARRAYNLTRGSATAHGNKKVAFESKIYDKLQQNDSLNRNEAKKEVRQDIRSEKREARQKATPLHEQNQTWAEQELECERSLHDRKTGE